jgi:DNA-binding transcriptional MerR regulator
MPIMTVKELAERICRPHEDIGAVIDRLRNWTKEGLLETAGDKNPGTGRRRHYDDSALVDALILTTLADIGIPSVRASQLKYDKKDLLNHGRHAVIHAQQSSQPVYLIIRRNYEPSNRNRPYATVIYNQHVTSNAIRDVHIPDNTETAIVINITALVKRIKQTTGE